METPFAIRRSFEVLADRLFQTYHTEQRLSDKHRMKIEHLVENAVYCEPFVVLPKSRSQYVTRHRASDCVHALSWFLEAVSKSLEHPDWEVPALDTSELLFNATEIETAYVNPIVQLDLQTCLITITHIPRLLHRPPVVLHRIERASGLSCGVPEEDFDTVW